jgi:acetyl esterase/lipase
MTSATSSDAPKPVTLAFDTVDGCDLLADVYEPVGEPARESASRPPAPRPAVLWIHGGGLIFGNRSMIRPTFRDALLRAGVVVISIEHRLAPETKLAEIVQDVERAWRWIPGDGAVQFRVDPGRVAAAGGSAGAYLSLLAGSRMAPPPAAIAAFWGFGDITKPWEAEPSAYYRSSYALMPREQALPFVGTTAVAGAPLDRDRDNFYLYCRQEGRWLAEVTAHDPALDAAWFDAYCPLRQIKPQFPPTILVHGREDTDVPCSESEDLAARLAQMGVAHRLIIEDGAGHGLARVTPERVAVIETEAANFLLERLSR